MVVCERLRRDRDPELLFTPRCVRLLAVFVKTFMQTLFLFYSMEELFTTPVTTILAQHGRSLLVHAQTKTKTNDLKGAPVVQTHLPSTRLGYGAQRCGDLLCALQRQGALFLFSLFLSWHVCHASSDS